MKQFRKMTIPYIVWMSVMIVIPMLFIFMYGITKEGNSVVTLNFTLDNFAKFFVEPIYIDVLIRSMRIAVVTLLSRIFADRGSPGNHNSVGI